MNLDPEKLVSVAHCASVAEATALQAVIEEEGIACVVNGDALNSAFGNVAPSLCDSKLLVRFEDAAKATSIIKSARVSFSAPRQDNWFCGKCLEEVDGGFELCWSCEQTREEVEASFPATADAVVDLKFPAVDTDQLGRSTDNPYESPRAIGVAEEEDDFEIDPDVAAVESKMIMGLLISAGSFLCPVVPAALAFFVFNSAFRKRLPLSGIAKFSF